MKKTKMAASISRTLLLVSLTTSLTACSNAGLSEWLTDVVNNIQNTGTNTDDGSDSDSGDNQGSTSGTDSGENSGDNNDNNSSGVDNTDSGSGNSNSNGGGNSNSGGDSSSGGDDSDSGDGSDSGDNSGSDDNNTNNGDDDSNNTDTTTNPGTDNPTTGNPTGNSLRVTPYPLYADGTAMPADEVTGFDLFEIDPSTNQPLHFASLAGADNNLFADLPPGKYAARTVGTKGRSALSLPVSIGSSDWKNHLPEPNEFNTFDATQVTELNNCLSTAATQQVCYLSSRAGDFNTRVNGAFISINASGTGPDDRITLMPVPGDKVKIAGNWSRNDPDPGGSSYRNQRLIQINADWTRVYGLELSDSNRYGIEVNGAYAHIEENDIHHVWHSGILLNNPGPSGHLNGSSIIYNNVSYVANGTGIWLSYSTGDEHTVDNNLIKGNLTWRNGFLSDDSEAPTAPGNADGIGIFKACDESHDASAGGWLDSDALGRENQCQGNKLVRNIAIWNADDCVDISSGKGTLLLGNISANCGDEGNRGFKVYPNISESMTWINNIALHQNPNYAGYGSSWGFEVRVNLPGANTSRSSGYHDFIGNLGLHNDTSSSNINMNFTSSDLGSNSGKLYNNVSGLGGSDTIRGNSAFIQGTNHWQSIQRNGAPEVTDPSYTLVSQQFTGKTIRERWYYKYNEIISKLMSKKNGNLYNNGTLLTEFYHASPADHETSPANSDSNEKSIWFALDKTNPVPDKGIAYRYMHAPFITVVNSSGTDGGSTDPGDNTNGSDGSDNNTDKGTGGTDPDSGSGSGNTDPTDTGGNDNTTDTTGNSTGPTPDGQGNVFYVDQNHTNASDANDGMSEESPWATLDHAVRAVEPGDFVYIKGSEDPDSGDAVYDQSNKHGLNIQTPGEANAEITFRNFPGHTVVIRGNNRNYGINLNNASHHHFYGLKFSHFSQATEGFSAKTNITIEQSEFSNTVQTGLRLRNITQLTLRDLYIHDCYESGISIRDSRDVLIERVESSHNNLDPDDGDGFHTIGGDNLRIVDSIARNNGEDGFDLNTNATLVNVIAEDHSAVNIKLWRRSGDNYAPKTITIINSLIRNAGEAGIKISEGAQLVLLHSVVDNNAEEGIAFRSPSNRSQNPVTSEITNSIISGNGYQGVDLRSGNLISETNNLFYDNNGGHKSGFSLSSQSVTSMNPMFVNPDQGDYHLEANSPAIDNGISIIHDDVKQDYEGDPRPSSSAIDIGLDERI